MVNFWSPMVYVKSVDYVYRAIIISQERAARFRRGLLQRVGLFSYSKSCKFQNFSCELRITVNFRSPRFYVKSVDYGYRTIIISRERAARFRRGLLQRVGLFSYSKCCKFQNFSCELRITVNFGIPMSMNLCCAYCAVCCFLATQSTAHARIWRQCLQT